MSLSWCPVIWVDIIGSTLILLLAVLCVLYALRLLRKKREDTFYHYIFLLTLSFVFFAVSRSFGHLVKQGLLFYDQQAVWKAIAPFSGAVNTATFIIIFSFGLYFFRSRTLYQELKRHKRHLASLVEERTRELTETNLELSQEVAERARTEEQHEKTLGEFSAVMDAIDYGVLFMDAELHARIGNRAFRKMWGMSEEFVAGGPELRDLIQYNRYNNLYDVADEEFERYMDEREAEVKAGAIAPVEFRRKDGSIFQYQCVVLPNNWRMLTYFDITELKKTQEKLAQSQKMEAIGLMAGGVAHDLNNILSGVVSYPDLLLSQLPRDSELQKPLELIRESGRRAADVVADLLTVARGVAGVREISSLNTLIEKYLQSPEGLKMQSSFPEVRLETRLDPELVNITCSPVHVTKCLMNLLTNAAEAIVGAGTIQVATENRYVDAQVSANQYIEPGEYAVIRITDTGKGITDEDIDHIFEPFYSKKHMGRSGTGLGLAIVWNTVQEHNGAVTVDSSGQGTCFTLYFPVTRAKIHEKPTGIAVDQLKGNRECILIVDDEEQQRSIASQMLSALNYQVETAGSGEEAVALVRKKAMDLIILDMIMEPGINGRQTYEQIVTFQPGQRAIIASGFSENEEVKKAQKLGAGDFIHKPYTIEQLGLAVKNALS